ALSHSTRGAPRLALSHSPPKPCQRVLLAAGPNVSAPVVLSNTAKALSTPWTYWVRPAAPLVSGAGAVTVKLPSPTPMPSKLTPATALSVGERTVEDAAPLGDGNARTVPEPAAGAGVARDSSCSSACSPAQSPG